MRHQKSSDTVQGTSTKLKNSHTVRISVCPFLPQWSLTEETLFRGLKHDSVNRDNNKDKIDK